MSHETKISTENTDHNYLYANVKGYEGYHSLLNAVNNNNPLAQYLRTHTHI